MKFLELRIPPPVIALLLAVLMWLLPGLVGTIDVPFTARVVVAVALVLLGQAISISGMLEFRRARTTINPVKANAASALVSSGIYRFTRNPMYLGLSLTLLGWAAYLSNPVTLLFIVVFVLYITRFQIKPEERILYALFGEPYAAYMRRVRRWL